MLPQGKGLECQVEMFSCECFVARLFNGLVSLLSSECFVLLSWSQSLSIFYFLWSLTFVFVGSQIFFQRML